MGHCRSNAMACGALLAAIAMAGPGMAAGDIGAGLVGAAKCEACHGLDGISKIPEAPNIAGQVEAYLIKQLTAFKTGERQNEMMSVVAPTLSEKDIADLAAYYAAIEIKLGKMPNR